MDILLYSAIPNDLRGLATCPSPWKGGKPRVSILTMNLIQAVVKTFPRGVYSVER